jgi:hypothetical protein
MTTDGPGLRLARAYFTDAIAPIVAAALPAARYGAAALGPGSDILGLDTERSTDHGWGPRVQLFLDPGLSEGDRQRLVAALVAGVPAEFGGYPTRFPWPGDEPADPRLQVTVTDLPAWSVDAFGFDVTAAPPNLLDWLGLPWQVLATANAGAVFRDDLGTLSQAKSRLRWYPDDVWRYVLAAQWQRIGQEEAFVGRTGEVGDRLGSAVLGARLIRDLMQLAFLIERRFPPYGKWLGTGFSRLPLAPQLTPLLASVLAAPDWLVRERALTAAGEVLARRTNALALAEPVDPTCRQFWERPFQVLDAGRFTRALLGAITDPVVRTLPAIGCVDQFIDSTDVLSHIGRARRAAKALLEPGRA